jgi:hypothetical protein
MIGKNMENPWENIRVKPRKTKFLLVFLVQQEDVANPIMIAKERVSGSACRI